MMTVRKMLLPFALLGFSGEAMARGWSADWKLIGVAEDRTEVLVRPESVRELPPSADRRFTVRQVWAGFDQTGASGIDAGRKIVLFQYDCASQRMLIAAATDFTADGKVIARNAVPSDRADLYEKVEPATLGATIMATACPA
ncbi:surface-adhesin E family protein [Novosphingobium sp. AAP83]|uniref:surface-adhesin E family protein n=1 Tax=Novosphingobium sp. AAP83 TaxID=1523425 RepID=UPI000B1AD02D|nr:surface-adhesin E family protein [Novosphingobium sp. AAP83]